MKKEDVIKVLEKQIEKLGDKEFDLTAWKNSSELLLEKIFGRGNPKTDVIRKIRYDQGSWVLRDETGYTNSMEACKKLGKEVIEEAIMELEAFGPPEDTGLTLSIGVILSALEDELTGVQIRELKKILTDDSSLKNKKNLLITKLKSYGADSGFAILAGILADISVTRGIGLKGK